MTPRARGRSFTLGTEALLQCRKKQKNVSGAAIVAHEADAPDFAFEIAQAAADFDAELAQ